MCACVPVHVPMSVPVFVCMCPISSGVVQQHVQMCKCMEAEWLSVSIAYVFICCKTDIAHFEACDCLPTFKMCNVCLSSYGHICSRHRFSGHIGNGYREFFAHAARAALDKAPLSSSVLI